MGTAAAQARSRSIITVLGVKLMTRPEIYLTGTEGLFDSAGRIASASTEEFLSGFMKKFADWVKKNKPA